MGNHDKVVIERCRIASPVNNKRNSRLLKIDLVRNELESRLQNMPSEGTTPFGVLFDTLYDKQPYFSICSDLCPKTQTVARTIAKRVSESASAGRAIELLFTLYEGIGSTATTYNRVSTQIDIYIRFIMTAVEILSEVTQYRWELTRGFGPYSEDIKGDLLRGMILKDIVEEDMLNSLVKAGYFKKPIGEAEHFLKMFARRRNRNAIQSAVRGTA